MKKGLLILVSILLNAAYQFVAAQATMDSVAAVHLAQDFVQAHLQEWNLVPSDVQQMKVSDFVADKSTGITRVYFQQVLYGINIHDGTININIDSHGNIFFPGNHFISHAVEKVNGFNPVLKPAAALNAFSSLHQFRFSHLQLKRTSGNNQYVFEDNSISRVEIPVRLVYQLSGDELRLAWEILFLPNTTADYWCTRMDAITGALLDEHNLTTYCHQGGTAFYGESNGLVHPDLLPVCTPEINGSETYNVWPPPYMNPEEGPRTLVISPADTIASPFGWHDVNGIPGPEYTITRGNNAHAFEDREGIEQSAYDEPDGGNNLYFDFPFNPAAEPEVNLNAAVVNLFYWTNYMHDFAYRFGFDEAGGNFQENNYNHGGKGNDALLVMAQQGATIGHSNNAYYQPAVDGSPGKIRVFLFYGTKSFLTVDAPNFVAGRYRTSFPSQGWGNGAYLANRTISGELIKVYDGIEDPYTSDGCEALINASEVNGKIALIDRGGCEFGWKALQAQNAGAIAVVFCNLDDDSYTMNPGSYGSMVEIPVIMIGVSDCQSISEYLQEGIMVTLKDPGVAGPSAKDADFDNGIIAHEYAHGISDRIVGGPSTICLENAEQMSEGWSDFFALATTAKAGDTGTMKRGFATYLFGDDSAGRGFRRYAYTTDMDLMPLTYGDIAPDPEEHNLGEVWCAVLWDMYWALVDQYGWSADVYDESSGNYRAIRLVFEGMKNIPCSPGLIDARDGILAADEVLYGGADVCLLWHAFSRRGLGYSANQGSANDGGDQKEAFDIPPVCTNSMLIEKRVTQFIQPGEDIAVQIRVGNYKSAMTSQVVVTDEIPEGTSLKMNSANYPVTLHDNSAVFEIGDLDVLAADTITYILETNPEAWSQRKYLDSVSVNSSLNWLTYTLGIEATNDWRISNANGSHSGHYAWFAPQIEERSRQALELNPNTVLFHVDGDHPTLRFYHRYFTQPGLNGGVVDIKEAASSIWTRVSTEVIRNGYDGLINYRTFISPGMKAFSGNSGTSFKATYIDLEKWRNKDIQVRFRFGTDNNTHTGLGWLIDDIEYMDMLNFNGQACLSTQEGDHACTIAPEGGTIVDSREETTSNDEVIRGQPFSLYPNPVKDVLQLDGPVDFAPSKIELYSADGRLVLAQEIQAAESHITVPVQQLDPGIYLVSIMSATKAWTGKVVIED